MVCVLFFCFSSLELQLAFEAATCALDDDFSNSLSKFRRTEKPTDLTLKPLGCGCFLAVLTSRDCSFGRIEQCLECVTLKAPMNYLALFFGKQYTKQTPPHPTDLPTAEVEQNVRIEFSNIGQQQQKRMMTMMMMMLNTLIALFKSIFMLDFIAFQLASLQLQIFTNSKPVAQVCPKYNTFRTHLNNDFDLGFVIQTLLLDL